MPPPSPVGSLRRFAKFRNGFAEVSRKFRQFRQFRHVRDRQSSAFRGKSSRPNIRNEFVYSSIVPTRFVCRRRNDVGVPRDWGVMPELGVSGLSFVRCGSVRDN